MEQDDAARKEATPDEVTPDEVTPDEGRVAATGAGRQDAPDLPPPTNAGVPRALFYLALVALVVMIAGYVNLHRRMNTLERGITGLQASVLDLPEATIDAIVAYQNGQAQERAQQEQQAAGGGVTIDDDAWIGDREQAQLAIVEFSDFNCPYCARFHQETLAHIIDTYVRDGRVLYVYRDYIGVGGQTSLDAAAAAECVREQAGDEAYLTLIHALFSAQGRKSKDMVVSLARDLELDQADFDACVESNRFDQEVADDTRDGRAAGIRGTPGFVIGTLNEDGSVDGVHLPGAQPIAIFDRVINEQLALLD